MQFAGEQRFSHDRQSVWNRLVDLKFLASVMPGFQKIENSEQGRIVFRVKPGFSFLTGSLKMTLEILDEQAPESTRLRIHGKGIGTSVVVETTIALSIDGDETKLIWNSEVIETGGMLKAVSTGLIEAASRKVIAEAWENIHRELGDS